MSLDPLLERAGRWSGTSRLLDPGYGIDERCDSAAVLLPLLGDRFVRLDYTWSYRATPQEGSLLLGWEPEAARHTGYWIDTWHNGRTVMACEGSAGDGEGVVVRGRYAAPPGPDWGWRIEVAPEGADGLRLSMFNIDPEGAEALAVDGRYRRDGREPVAASGGGE